MEIHPAPLVPKFSELLLQLSRIQSLQLHLDIDIVDWSRSEAKTVGALEALQARIKCKLTFDLMMDHPESVVPALVKDSRVDTIVLNTSCQDPIEKLFDQIHMYKIKAGISINPEDHFYNIVPFIPEVELIQIYTIMPGAQGQPFLPERLKLIPLLRQFGFTGLIGIDGGVNLKTISLIKEYQPDILSVGSAIMHAEDPVAAYKELLEALRK